MKPEQDNNEKKDEATETTSCPITDGDGTLSATLERWRDEDIDQGYADRFTFNGS